MDLEQKLAIFEKYDYSKSALIKKAGIDYRSSKSELYHGIANMVQILITNIGILASGKQKDIGEYKKVEDRVYKDYGWLQTKYQAIDWDELDPSDPDCDVFFKMQELINDLGQSINSFLEKSRGELQNRINSIDYKNIKKQIQNINKLTQKYEEIKERLKKEVDSERLPSG